METIHLYLLVHKGEERIAVAVPPVSSINTILKQVSGIRWSRTNRKWLLPCNKEAVNELLQRVKGLAEVNIDMLSEQLHARQKKPEQNGTMPGEDPLTIKAVKAMAASMMVTDGLSAENREALKQYLQMLIIKAYSPKTIRTYRTEFRIFLVKLAHIRASSLNATHIMRYLEYCAVEQKLAENTLHSRLNAIKFYYEQVLGQDRILWQIPRAKKPLQLPKVLSEVELKRLFSALSNLKHKAILFTAYSAGLRVSEVVKLRVGDIDSERMQIFVERAKGKKDRVVNLSVLLLDVLRQYIKLQRPRPGYYLFGNEDGQEPFSERSAQAIFQRAKNMAGIRKNVSFHSLRHSFATHLLEKGIDVRYIKDILGHFDIRTTERYLHVRKDQLINIMSPLDSLYDDGSSDLLQIGATNNLKTQPPTP